jgi:hypothetical protein
VLLCNFLLQIRCLSRTNQAKLFRRTTSAGLYITREILVQETIERKDDFGNRRKTPTLFAFHPLDFSREACTSGGSVAQCTSLLQGQILGVGPNTSRARRAQDGIHRISIGLIELNIMVGHPRGLPNSQEEISEKSAFLWFVVRGTSCVLCLFGYNEFGRKQLVQ